MKEPMRGQRKAVFDHLLAKRSITSIQAFELYGATRLSAIIFDLRKLGYNIVTHEIVSKNRYGLPCIYAEYRLED